MSEMRSVDGENFTDPALDAEMDQFKFRLLRQGGLMEGTRFRMRPNVSPGWLDSIRRRLEQAERRNRADSNEVFVSPRALDKD